MSLNVGKILFSGQPQVVRNNQQVGRNPDNSFVKNSFNFGEANPNRPESRNDILGRNLYCLA